MQVAKRMQERQQHNRRLDQQRWAGWREGDGVLLSCGKSAGLMKAFDDDGCQIRLDGVVKEIGQHYATVLVLLEFLPGCYGVTVLLKPEEMEPHTGVNRWTKGNARAVDRKRRTGSAESEFWAPL